MNKNKTIALLMILTLMAVSLFTACNKAPSTIEEYLNSDTEAMDELKETAEKSGLKVSVSGNDINYSYDVSNYEDMTEELAKSEQIVNALGDALEESEDNFSGLCKSLEDESKIEGVRIIVKYNYGEEELVSKTFTASGSESSDSE